MVSVASQRGTFDRKRNAIHKKLTTEFKTDMMANSFPGNKVME
jgi:hypothetical protein